MQTNTHVTEDIVRQLETEVSDNVDTDSHTSEDSIHADVPDDSDLASETEVDIGKTNSTVCTLRSIMPLLEPNTNLSQEGTPVSPEVPPVSPERTHVSPEGTLVFPGRTHVSPEGTLVFPLLTNTPTVKTPTTVPHFDEDMPINTPIVNDNIVTPTINNKRTFDANTPCIDLNVFTFIGSIFINDSYEMKNIHSSKESYASFLHLFATCIVPTAQYKDAIFKDQSKFEKSFSEHDEAMCITILDNNLSKWKMEAVYKLENMGTLVPKDLKAISLTKEQIKSIPNAKYTMRNSTDKATNLRSGWGHQGMKAFHDNMEKVTSFRKTEQFKQYKLYYLECVVDKAGGRRTKKQRKTRCTNDDSDNNMTSATLCENLFDKYYEATGFAV